VSRAELNQIPTGAALYFHVPFCSSICDFCAFDKAKPSPGDWDLFRKSFEFEWSSLYFEGNIDSVFWGGGTPGLLKSADILRFGEKFREVIRPEGEWTVELTPLCVTPEKMEAWKEVGVNRLSLGVQSFSPRLLEAMGRPYETSKIEQIVSSIRSGGFARLNLDLIIAFPGQSREELVADLEKAVALDPDHLSVYCLTLEEDTALYARLAKTGQASDPEEEADLYEIAWDFLDDAGYEQYEISNFAKKGARCHHHMNVWNMGSWRGLGPSAASQIEEVRFQNPHGLRDWAEFVSSPEELEFPDMVRTSGDERLLELLVFGLRMNDGVSESILGKLSDRVQSSVGDFLTRLELEGHVTRKNSQLRLSRMGRLVADEISRCILSKFSLHDQSGGGKS